MSQSGNQDHDGGHENVDLSWTDLALQRPTGSTYSATSKKDLPRAPRWLQVYRRIFRNQKHACVFRSKSNMPLVYAGPVIMAYWQRGILARPLLVRPWLP